MLKIETVLPQKDYELIDSGDGEKLERFGPYLLRRPDPQAVWRKKLPESIWQEYDGYFKRSGIKGNWILKKTLPKSWNMILADLVFKIVPSPFKHTGIFPEQYTNWQWIKEKIDKFENKNIKVLNLFGYTGGATLVCAKAGAQVVHVDASKSAIAWGRENAELSGLKEAPIRWMLEDAKLFVKRELKRGNFYDGIILDPPAFGHGPKGETWKIEEDLVGFIEETKKLLSNTPCFFVINGYAAGYSSIAYKNNMTDLVEKFGGVLESGEIGVSDKDGKVLPCGIFARWSSL